MHAFTSVKAKPAGEGNESKRRCKSTRDRERGPPGTNTTNKACVPSVLRWLLDASARVFCLRHLMQADCLRWEVRFVVQVWEHFREPIREYLSMDMAKAS